MGSVEIRGRPDKGGRFTIPNPGGTYRILMEYAGEFRLEQQVTGLTAFGDLVNQLGKLEDAYYGNKK